MFTCILYVALLLDALCLVSSKYVFWLKRIKIKRRSFKSSEHINEKVNGPYRGFDLLSFFSDFLNGAKEKYCYFAILHRIVDTKTSIIQTEPNILNVG